MVRWGIALTHDVGDPSFEEINLGTLDYYYVQGPPNSPFWKDHSLSAGKNAAYTSNLAVNLEPAIPDPHSGDQAIDGEGAYNYQVLNDIFVAGRTYTYTAYIPGLGGQHLGYQRPILDVLIRRRRANRR